MTFIISNFYNIISIKMQRYISFTFVQYYHCPNNIYCNLIPIFFNISFNVTYIHSVNVSWHVLKINSKVIIFQNKANFYHKSYAQLPVQKRYWYGITIYSDFYIPNDICNNPLDHQGMLLPVLRQLSFINCLINSLSTFQSLKMHCIFLLPAFSTV